MSISTRSIRATPAALCLATLWAFLVLLITNTSADADLWGHLRFGLDMLASASIRAVDRYSFTADRAWVNHEWLAEWLMAVSYSGAGALGLNLLKLVVIVVIGGFAWTIARQERANPIASQLYVALTVFATYSRTQVIRPQLFSVALFVTLLYLLRETERGRRRAIWGVPLCFAVWVNLHGAWIVGLAVLGVWMAGEAWRRRGLAWTLELAAVGALTLLATLVNPYGVELWRFLSETVRPDRPDITDWLPLLQLPPAILIIESILPVIAITALVRKRAWRGVPVRDAAILALLAVATFRVGRVDAFFEAATAIVLAEPIVAWLNGLQARVRGPFLRASAPVGVMTLTLIAYAAVAAAVHLRAIDVSGAWAPDRTATAFLREHSRGARVLTWFDWGEYALWQLSPAGIRVSMDGRRETVYRAGVIRDHQRFYQGHADMVDYPDRIGADQVWLPTRLPIVELLKRHGWVPLLDTGQSVILVREGTLVATRTVIPITGPDRFPWP